MKGVELTPRQAEILRRVVETHVELGQPVGSKWLAERDDLPWGPSTVRAELARLEEVGLLQHPHTSAGRVPTDAGYRHYVDDLLEDGEPPARAPRFELELSRTEIDATLRDTTEQLSQITNLLAIVSAPPLASTTIRRVEVLLLQPQVAMIVVITSTGGVTKRVVSYERPVDSGLVEWASSYLNETLGGMALGARMIQSRMLSPELDGTERQFLETLSPAFSELEDTAEDTLYVGGAGRLLSEDRFQELTQINDLMAMLERRVVLLSLLRGMTGEPSVYLRIGQENSAPELRSLSMVAANYGLGHRNLGAVSVLGPTRMDYVTAIATVREAASELSRFVGDLYDE
jgi:heat-inducible transcriptional repressor